MRSWIKVDDQFPDHPKVAAAGPLGMAMQVAALCYCNRHMTDGRIPRSVAKLLLNFDGLAWHETSPDGLMGAGMDVEWQHVVDDLVKAGLWRETDAGWEINDYLVYQRSSEQIRSLSATRAEAGRRGGSKREATPKQTVEQTGSNGQAEQRTKNKELPTSERRPDVDRLCDLLAGLVAANCDGKRPTITKRWRDEARRLLDTDGVSEADAERVMRWATSDSFWRSNILSMPKFREKYQALKLRLEPVSTPAWAGER